MRLPAVGEPGRGGRLRPRVRPDRPDRRPGRRVRLALLTGINGPTCGGTRLVWYLLHGDLVQTARHHLVALAESRSPCTRCSSGRPGCAGGPGPAAARLGLRRIWRRLAALFSRVAQPALAAVHLVRHPLPRLSYPCRQASRAECGRVRILDKYVVQECGSTGELGT